jgi:hypothetical protein
MPFIAKTAPISANVGDTVLIEERPMYGGKDIAAGAPVFLWASETQGGNGLWARGTVLRVELGAKKPVVAVRVEQMVNSGNFGITQIAPHRDSVADTPIAGLAHKLYRHSHNKVAGIATDEADLLQQLFGQVRP